MSLALLLWSRSIWLEISLSPSMFLYGFNMAHIPPWLRVPLLVRKTMLKICPHIVLKASLDVKRLDLLCKHLKRTCLSQWATEVMSWIRLSRPGWKVVLVSHYLRENSSFLLTGATRGGLGVWSQCLLVPCGSVMETSNWEETPQTIFTRRPFSSGIMLSVQSFKCLNNVMRLCYKLQFLFNSRRSERPRDAQSI